MIGWALFLKSGVVSNVMKLAIEQAGALYQRFLVKVVA